uniref:Apple domain-containing protein n=1 Tax=Trichuris muris TaxID=70415 RepID=A0A5S6QIC9_TRIMR
MMSCESPSADGRFLEMEISSSTAPRETRSSATLRCLNRHFSNSSMNHPQRHGAPSLLVSRCAETTPFKTATRFRSFLVCIDRRQLRGVVRLCVCIETASKEYCLISSNADRCALYSFLLTTHSGCELAVAYTRCKGDSKRSNNSRLSIGREMAHSGSEEE